MLYISVFSNSDELKVAVVEIKTGSDFVQVGPDTELTPFRKPNSKDNACYTSNDVRDVKKLNYTYPELQLNLTPADMYKMVSGQNSAVCVGKSAQSVLRSFKSKGTSPPLKASPPLREVFLKTCTDKYHVFLRTARLHYERPSRSSSSPLI